MGLVLNASRRLVNVRNTLCRSRRICGRHCVKGDDIERDTSEMCRCGKALSVTYTTAAPSTRCAYDSAIRSHSAHQLSELARTMCFDKKLSLGNS